MKNLCITLVLMGAAVGALLLAGCGGDGGEEAGTANVGDVAVPTGSLPKERFIERADAVCKDTIKRRDAAFKAYLRRTGLTVNTIDVVEHADPLSRVYVSVYRKHLDRLRALGAPEGDEEEVGEILTGMQQILDEIEAQPRDFVLNPNPFGPVSGPARDYGFRVCAEAYFGGAGSGS